MPDHCVLASFDSEIQEHWFVLFHAVCSNSRNHSKRDGDDFMSCRPWPDVGYKFPESTYIHVNGLPSTCSTKCRPEKQVMLLFTICRLTISQEKYSVFKSGLCAMENGMVANG